MTTNVFTYVLMARGAGNSPEEARAMARRRLAQSANEIADGKQPSDATVDVRTIEPGGGGGPCAAEFIDVQVNYTPSGLPEAQPRPSDDD